MLQLSRATGATAETPQYGERDDSAGTSLGELILLENHMKSLGVGLLLFTFAQVLFSQQPNVEITKATYGAGDKQVDVTEWVRVLVSQGSAIKANNQLTGKNDPAVGQVKTLTVQYVENGVRKTATVKEGETLKYGDTITTNEKQSPAPESSARPESDSAAPSTETTQEKQDDALIPLKASVNPGTTYVPGKEYVGNYNQKITHLQAFKTDRAIKIMFDFDFHTRFPQGVFLRLIVHIFDENGMYLTYFRTAELFTMNEEAFRERAHDAAYSAYWARVLREGHGKQPLEPDDLAYRAYEARVLREWGTSVPPAPDNSTTKLTLLKDKANVLECPVNRRDLRDTSMLVIGFEVK
jgi:hypothetical protein